MNFVYLFTQKAPSSEGMGVSPFQNFCSFWADQIVICCLVGYRLCDFLLALFRGSTWLYLHSVVVGVSEHHSVSFKKGERGLNPHQGVTGLELPVALSPRFHCHNPILFRYGVFEQASKRGDYVLYLPISVIAPEVTAILSMAGRFENLR